MRQENKARQYLSGERLLADQALHLLLRLNSQLMEARADRNSNRSRRLIKARSKAALQARRRWAELSVHLSCTPFR